MKIIHVSVDVLIARWQIKGKTLIYHLFSITITTVRILCHVNEHFHERKQPQMSQAFPTSLRLQAKPANHYAPLLAYNKIIYNNKFFYNNKKTNNDNN